MRRLVCLLLGHVHDGIIHEDGKGAAWYSCARCGRVYHYFNWADHWLNPIGDVEVEEDENGIRWSGRERD